MFTPKDHSRPVDIASSAAGQARQGELDTVDLAHAEWRKSSWSAMNGNCVAVAELRAGLIGVCDTKDGGLGPVLLFSGPAWRSFIRDVKSAGLPR